MLASRFALRQVSTLTRQLSAGLVAQKDLDAIAARFGDKTWEKMMKYGVMFSHIIKEGFLALKVDLEVLLQLKRRTNLTLEERTRMRDISTDFKKCSMLLLVQILPFSGVLFFLYMYTYPGSIPTWFVVDKYHEMANKLKIERQNTAIEYFKKCNITKGSQLKFDQMGLEDWRKLAELLFGEYRDGTVGFNRLSSSSRHIPYLINNNYSIWLIKRRLNYKLNLQEVRYLELIKLQFSERIIWWFDKVMEGQMLIGASSSSNGLQNSERQ